MSDALKAIRDQIKNEIPISNIIADYLEIKTRGASKMTVCPFHSDSSPSLNINDNKKMFKCFACNTFGDAISFVMMFKNIKYIDALKEISENHGLDMKAFNKEFKIDPKTKEALFVLNQSNEIYYQNGLNRNCDEFNEFIKNRGISDDLIKLYSIGIAGDDNLILNWIDSISEKQKRENYLETAIELGLVRVNQNKLVDTFKNRVMFPIKNHRNETIAFTARTLLSDELAKYINSKESFIFKKSEILYGYNLAQEFIQKESAVIIVEGNMDQIALYKCGFKNTVAAMGTSIGANSIERLLKMTKTIYLALDSDPAGFNAMERLNRELAIRGILARYIDFSPFKDPDEYLKNCSADVLKEKVENAPVFYDVLLNKIIPNVVPAIIDRRLDLLKKIFETLSPLGTNLMATERIIENARKLGLQSSSEHILKNYQDYLEKNPKF